jgi:proteasome lid subunit RPN8/RPN11
MEIIKIKWPVIEMVLELSKDKYPQPYICKLLATDDVISEISIFSNIRNNIPFVKPLELTMVSALSYGNLLERLSVSPDFTFEREFVGFAISHTDESLKPTEEDIQLFSFKGKIHLITANPFDEDSWTVYESGGKRIEVEIIE